MTSRTYTLFRNAILAEQQVTCVYEERYRELRPHVIGTDKHGEEAVLAWQFAGESSGPLARGRLTSDHSDLRQQRRSRYQYSHP
jgi:hypothetical protein